MTTKLTKNDLKKDAVTEELQKGFVWTTRHMNGVIIFLVGFALVGAGYSAYSYFDTKKEEESQELYYQAEKTYLNQKQKFDAYEAEANKPPVAKKAKEEKEAATEPKGEKPSGDLVKDYGKAISELEFVVSKDSSSNSAMMAALTLSDIYSQYQMNDKAQANLDKIKVGSNLLSIMIMDRKASTKANLGDCKSALSIWDQALAVKTAKFMAADIKLKKGLCFESMNDISNAKVMYTQAKEGEAQSPTTKTAEKYLQLLASKETATK